MATDDANTPPSDELSPREVFAKLTYGTYLKVPELLELQEPRVPGRSHDELLFIIIHQAYELWFKQILFELDTVQRLLARGNLKEARRLGDRVIAIMKVLVEQIHVLETMTPRDFCHFRAALTPASGFQSIQFREVEFLCGLKVERYLQYLDASSPEHAKLRERLDAPSLRDTLYDVLRSKGFSIPDATDEDSDAFDAAVRSLLPVYSETEQWFDLYQLLETLVAIDQWLGIWRYHHVRVVERIIGSKWGTGGSPGVKYLAATLSKRAFPLLWAVRSYLDEDSLFATYVAPGAVED
jgi:tryptophan 2,3-dioxygenase